ncbi:MarR family winged helix-turn-helix transcriptional regulator [Clostridium manihotivorum]|uniref:MarR family transcriptional regulator n=1 Tax=Clostridium manihotivorum TaxID=2320868 RepID=A0A3R5X3S4_9CLOT|nr:MarR family transcriptional regulator [Clostridium manihotivorum]QAA33791.1 MarR family transcriptional regulator [Clostridium manihotivorum]
MSEMNELLCDCLYFSANKLARIMTKMADEEFRITGLSPTYAFLVSIVNEKPGISQKDIGEALHITPSTITRFIDKLENSGYVNRRTEGKNSFIYSTEKGMELQKDINRAWSNLQQRYSKSVGKDEYVKVTEMINSVCSKLEK